MSRARLARKLSPICPPARAPKPRPHPAPITSARKRAPSTWRPATCARRAAKVRQPLGARSRGHLLRGPAGAIGATCCSIVLPATRRLEQAIRARAPPMWCDNWPGWGQTVGVELSCCCRCCCCFGLAGTLIVRATFNSFIGLARAQLARAAYLRGLATTWRPPARCSLSPARPPARPLARLPVCRRPNGEQYNSMTIAEAPEQPVCKDKTQI